MTNSATVEPTPTQEAVQVHVPTPLPGNRPIDASNLNVLETISAMGQRPIVSSNIQILDIISISGNRPIVSSNLHISGIGMIFGNRPIASNNVDNEDLMGYLD
ncbi:MAG: hypothetical protein U7123_23255 [Potamolinea sp.]